VISYDGARYTPLAFLKSFFFGDVGFGESYVAGDISVDDDLLSFIGRNRGAGRLFPYFRKMNNGSDVHYNLSAEFFERLLGRSLSYTCANFNGTDDLDHAQAYKHGWHKHRLDLKPDCRLLECGSGWGGFRRYLSNDVGSYTGLTISSEQKNFCCKRSAKGEILVRSWQDFSGEFDRFTSIGMIEHVGRANLPAYFEWVNDCLVPGGVGTLQFISRDKPISAWADKYIFNGAEPPNFNEVLRLMRQNNLIVTEHVERGGDYILTLEAWLFNLQLHRDWILNRFGVEFYRTFELYLSGGIVSFKSGDSQLIQLRFVVQG